MIKTETTVVEATAFKRREPLTVYNTLQRPVTTPMEICEGDLEGDYFGPDEELVDVNISLPYDITVIYIELSGDPTQANTNLGYGAEGEGVSFVNFEAPYGINIAVARDTFRYSADPEQLVPMGGYLQIATGDWIDNELTNGSFHYKIHYTYRCADGDPI